MRDKLLIIGASGHGKVIADIAVKMNMWSSVFFLDDNETAKECMKLTVIGKSNDAFKYYHEADIFVAIGNNAIRERLHEKLAAEGAFIPTLIHPSTVIGMDVELGIGTVVMAGAVINSSTHIGKGCIINTGATVDHDNVIEDFVHISPGVNLAGTVRVGKGSWIGLGSVVSNNISIIRGCNIGAGSVVIRDINEPGTYVGAPVRRVK